MLILFFYIQTQYNTLVLLKCKNLCRHSNYSTIGYSVFKGKWILVVINLIIIINNFGLCFAEMMYIYLIFQYPRNRSEKFDVIDNRQWFMVYFKSLSKHDVRTCHGAHDDSPENREIEDSILDRRHCYGYILYHTHI